MARILIADDDPDYLSAFCEGLTALGHVVTGVGNGKEALKSLQEATYDIVFLDVFMSGGGAISLIHMVKNADPGIPAVIITGKATILDSPILAEGLRLATAKIAKTTTLVDLDKLVRRYARGTS